jgi:hypothetical protein
MSYRALLVCVATNFWRILEFVWNRGCIIFFFLQTLCLFYYLPNCVLLFVLHISFLLLLFFLRVLLQRSNFHCCITGLVRLDIMRVSNNIQINLQLLAKSFCFFKTQHDEGWFRAETCACSWGLYSYSVICVGLIYCACSWGLYCYCVICVGLINCTVSWLLSNSVFFSIAPNCKWICELIQSSGTDLSTDLWS